MEKYTLYNQPINKFLEFINFFKGKLVVFIDTETTGLKGPEVEQLTQIAALATECDKDYVFRIAGVFNEKILLTPETKLRMEIEADHQWNVKNILEFNHYYNWHMNYLSEQDVINQLHEFISQHNPRQKEVVLIIQNAKFDVEMIESRSGKKLPYTIFDTKHLFQFQLLPLFQTKAENDHDYWLLCQEIGFSERDNGLISSSLKNVAPALKIDLTNTHDAFKDCMITMRAMQLSFGLLVRDMNVDISHFQKIRLESKK